MVFALIQFDTAPVRSLEFLVILRFSYYECSVLEYSGAAVLCGATLAFSLTVFFALKFLFTGFKFIKIHNFYLKILVQETRFMSRISAIIGFL